MRIFGTAERTASHRAGKAARTFVAAALALGMACGAGLQALSTQKAYAKPGTPYTYTVRVFPGQQGKFIAGDNEACFTFPPLTYNASANDGSADRVSLNQGNIEVKEPGKYYVRGWKVAGKDNDESTLFSSLRVTADMDLVVSYGVLADSVGYTVRYVDQSGNELFPTESFYANVGDRPVIAFRYIDGYLPDAYNKTGNLLANADDNVFVFTYTPVVTPEPVTVVVPTQEGNQAAPAAEGAAVEGAQADQAVTPEDAPAVAIEEPQDEAYISEDGTPLAAPAEIEDIRDEETPMASGNSLSMRSDVLDEGADVFFGQSVLFTVLGIGAVILIGVAVALIVIFRKKQHRLEAQVAMASYHNQQYGMASDYAQQSQQYPAPVQPTNTQQYAAPSEYAQQYPMQYDGQQYGNTQYGQTEDQINPQFGNPDDQ